MLLKQAFFLRHHQRRAVVERHKANLQIDLLQAVFGNGHANRRFLASPLLLVEKVDHLSPQAVVVGVTHHFQTMAGPRKRDPQNLANAGLRAIGHHYHPIRKQQRLIHIVGNHDTGELLRLGNLHQLLLQVAARQGIQSAKGLIQQQHPRTDGQSPGNGYPLFHPS